MPRPMAVLSVAGLVAAAGVGGYLLRGVKPAVAAAETTSPPSQGAAPPQRVTQKAEPEAQAPFGCTEDSVRTTFLLQCKTYFHGEYLRNIGGPQAPYSEERVAAKCRCAASILNLSKVKLLAQDRDCNLPYDIVYKVFEAKEVKAECVD